MLQDLLQQSSILHVKREMIGDRVVLSLLVLPHVQVAASTEELAMVTLKESLGKWADLSDEGLPVLKISGEF